MHGHGAELIRCFTYLESFDLTDQIAGGVAGGMPDIIEDMHRFEKVLHQ